LKSFCAEYSTRFHETPDPFALLNRNQNKGATFFQWFAVENLSIDFTIMLWRILAGAEINSVKYSYQRDRQSNLVIELLPLPGSPPGAETYMSDSRSDFCVLAAFRMLTFMGQPYLVAAFEPVMPTVSSAPQ
jgi:hypothetical protein